MAPRKPKPPKPVISPHHPLKLSCPVCGVYPFLLCRECGEEWTDSLRWLHKARYEAYQMEELFA